MNWVRAMCDVYTADGWNCFGLSMVFGGMGMGMGTYQSLAFPLSKFALLD